MTITPKTDLKGSDFMQQAMPIRDLQNSDVLSQISQEKLLLNDIYNKLAESEADVVAGRTKNAKDSLQRLREKHNV